MNSVVLFVLIGKQVMLPRFDKERQHRAEYTVGFVVGSTDRIVRVQCVDGLVQEVYKSQVVMVG